MMPNLYIDSGIWKFLKPSERAVLTVLNRYKNNKSGWCYPSIEKLVKETGYEAHAVCRATKFLARYSLIRKKRAPKRFFFQMNYKVLNEIETDFRFFAQKLQERRNKRIIAQKVHKSSEKPPDGSEPIEQKVQDSKKMKQKVKSFTLKNTAKSLNLTEEEKKRFIEMEKSGITLPPVIKKELERDEKKCASR